VGISKNLTIKDLSALKYTKLMIAILQNDKKEIDSHIISKINLDKQNEHGFNALTIAILSDQPNIAQRLINAGIDIHASDEMGLFPLHWAILMEQHSAAIKLIERGANLETPFLDGRSMLEVTKTNSCKELTKALEKKLGVQNK
jgi:ankyrin repeat protein